MALQRPEAEVFLATSIKLQRNLIEITLRHGCSPINLLHIFTTPFFKNAFGWVTLKASWISSLVHWAVNICNKNKLQTELIRIKDLTAWNSFPERIGDILINDKLKRLNVNNIKNTTSNDFETIWIKLPYLGVKGGQLLKSLKANLKHHFYKINQV